MVKSEQLLFASPSMSILWLQVVPIGARRSTLFFVCRSSTGGVCRKRARAPTATTAAAAAAMVTALVLEMFAVLLAECVSPLPPSSPLVRLFQSRTITAVFARVRESSDARDRRALVCLLAFKLLTIKFSNFALYFACLWPPAAIAFDRKTCVSARALTVCCSLSATTMPRAPFTKRRDFYRQRRRRRRCLPLACLLARRRTGE